MKRRVWHTDDVRNTVTASLAAFEAQEAANETHEAVLVREMMVSAVRLGKKRQKSENKNENEKKRSRVGQNDVVAMDRVNCRGRGLETNLSSSSSTDTRSLMLVFALNVLLAGCSRNAHNLCMPKKVRIVRFKRRFNAADHSLISVDARGWSTVLAVDSMIVDGIKGGSRRKWKENKVDGMGKGNVGKMQRAFIADPRPTHSPGKATFHSIFRSLFLDILLDPCHRLLGHDFIGSRLGRHSFEAVGVGNVLLGQSTYHQDGRYHLTHKKKGLNENGSSFMPLMLVKGQCLLNAMRKRRG
ncbi:hypothetical protein CPB84DRAFT_123419 [Gymnopilus junonius]|uniref:Uncharacterized protein n=1 Tax=Gymnopilus junonius TaxID=109634 RepID=A0A9P5TKF1_GYMJU|nr:hypothetical protein CPB84DRAFT_123419 [Gymnopilus junonius]